jgi:hypothetical protein
LLGALALFLGEARGFLALQLQAIGSGLRLLDLLDLAVVFVLARLLQRLLALRALMRGQGVMVNTSAMVGSPGTWCSVDLVTASILPPTPGAKCASSSPRRAVLGTVRELCCLPPSIVFFGSSLPRKQRLRVSNSSVSVMFVQFITLIRRCQFARRFRPLLGR